MKEKIIVLLSGGLDSLLVVKLLQEKDFDITAVYFELPFNKIIEKEIRNFCKKEKVKLKIFDCTRGKLLQEYLEIIKKPKYGTGAGINPCVDCRIFILEKTKEFADTLKGTSKKKIYTIATGEVLNERPMSQTKKSLELTEKKSGLMGRLIRPLCDIGIKGRSRKKQIALAKKFKINYPNPAGGCLLCEKLYCERLKKILNKKNLNYKDIQLLKIGRHFENSQIILGKNKKENELLEKESGMKIIPKQPGPTASVKNKKFEKKARELIQKYSKNKIEDFEVRK